LENQIKDEQQKRLNQKIF
jgi:hypothetical protein